MEAVTKSLEIDGQPRQFDPEKTFGMVKEEIRQMLPTDRVVTEIFINSRPIDLVEEDELHEKVLKEMGDVSFKTRDVNELFRESLQMAPQICSALKLDCDDVEAFLNKQELDNVGERVTEMTALLEWLIQLIMGVQQLGATKLEDMTFSQGKVMDTLTRMQFQLVQLHFNLGAQNWPEFLKILQNDFKGELSVWETLFSELSRDWGPQASKPVS